MPAALLSLNSIIKILNAVALPSALQVLIFVNCVFIFLLLVWITFQTLSQNPPKHFKWVWLQMGLLQFGYTLPWWIFMITLCAVLSYITPIYAIVLLAICSFGIYTIYITPRRLKVREIEDLLSTCSDTAQPTPNVKIAVVADIRLGVFSRRYQFSNIVRTINSKNVDAVIILGEWLYVPGADLVGKFMLLKAINKPVYVTHSEHDEQFCVKNDDLTLHKDNLSHAFTCLALTPIAPQPSTTPLNVDFRRPLSGVPTRSLQSQTSRPAIASNPVQSFNISSYNGCVLLFDNSDASKDKNSSINTGDDNFCSKETGLALEDTNKSSPTTSGIALIPASSQNITTISKSYRPYIIPSFGNKVVPFRLTSPTITIITLKM